MIASPPDPSLPTPEAPSPVPRGTSAALLAVAGAALVITAISALLAIPRTPAEFDYLARPTMWPLPFAAMNGFTPEQLSSHVARLCFLAPAVLLCAPFIGSAVMRQRWRAPPVWISATLAGLLVTIAALTVFRGTPVQDDEPTYMYQAEALRHGALMHAPIPKEAQFHEAFTIFASNGTTGKYLFGEPLLLAAGMLVGFPLLAHVLLAMITLMAIAGGARREGGEPIAPWAVALLAVSPQFVFTSAVPVSQAAALAGVAIAVWGATRRDFRGGLIAGFALGFALVSRPQVAVPCGVALLVTHVGRRRRMLVGTALGALPLVACVLAYDAVVTGSPLKLPWALSDTEMYGFGAPFGPQHPHVHTPLRALALTAVTLVRLNGWALGWPLSLAGPVAWAMLDFPRARAIAPWSAIAIATFAFQFGYYSVGVSDTGAVYHHAALPFIALSTAAAAERMLETRLRTFAVGFCVASAIAGTATFFVEHAARLRRLTDAVGPPIDATTLNTPAIVFTEPPRSTRPAGWVFSVPYRPRWRDEPVVVYPLGKNASALRAEHPGRSCYVRYADGAPAHWRVSGCDEPVVRAGLPPRAPATTWAAAFRWASNPFDL